MPHPTRTLARAATTLLALLLALACLPLTPASAADTDVSWTVRTASNAYGDNRSSFRHAVNPGGTLDDAMVVKNRGTKPLRLAVYASDGYTTEAGQLDLLTRDRKSTGVGAWLRPAKDTLEIQPGKSVTVPFTVTVPENATPGDHVGGLLTSLEQPDTAAGINVDRRLGIRVALRVGGELRPALTVENTHVAYDGTAAPAGKGTATVTYTVRNTGNVQLAARQEVELRGPFGIARTKGPRTEDTPALLPGERWKVTVKVKDVPPTVRLTAKATLLPLLTDASGSVTPLDPVRSQADAWAVPWTLLALILAALALAAAAVVLRRRTRAGRAAREEARVREAVEQALRTS